MAVIRPTLVRLVPSYADKLIAQRRPARTRLPPAWGTCRQPGPGHPAELAWDLVRCDVVDESPDVSRRRRQESCEFKGVAVNYFTTVAMTTRRGAWNGSRGGPRCTYGTAARSPMPRMSAA